MSEEEVPIACTLGAGDYQERVAWLAALNQRALRHHHRQDLRLEVTYAADAHADVTRLVEQERACCPFLAFSVVEGGDDVQLVIQAPEAAREAADALFAAFVAKAPVPVSCECC